MLTMLMGTLGLCVSQESALVSQGWAAFIWEASERVELVLITVPEANPQNLYGQEVNVKLR